MTGEPHSDERERKENQIQDVKSASNQTNANESANRHGEENVPGRRLKRFGRYLRGYTEPPVFVALLIAIFTFVLAIFAYKAWDEAQHGTRAIRETMDLNTRAILASDLKNWKINPSPLAAGISPTVAFNIKNPGHQFAHIFSATYESTFATKPTAKFGSIKSIPDFPALLGPDVDFPIIISGLPALAADQLPSLQNGQLFLWLRTIFIYRQDLGTVFQVRFTGRYGRGIDEKGMPDFRFSFPDNDVPPDRWGTFGFDGLRCLNINKSEPHNLGCGDP